MEIPKYINALFSDSNGDTIKVKLSTQPFVSGSIDTVVNWMVSNPIGNVDMPDIKSGLTLFFLACRYNPNDDLIIWLIETGETNLGFVNSNGDSVLEYLAKSVFNSPQISSRIKLLLKYHSFEFDRKNKFGDTLFEIFCYSGYLDVIQQICSNGYCPDKENIDYLIKKINSIITEECDDYWSLDEVDEEFLLNSLDKVNVFLESQK